MRGVCPGGDGHLCQGVLTLRCEGCSSTELPALGPCVLVRRDAHHGMPRARCAHSNSVLWLIEGWLACSAHPPEHEHFQRLNNGCRYLSREGKAKGNFPIRLLLLLLKKKNALMPAKCLALRMGRVFLALVRTLPLQMQMQPLQFWCFNWL